MMREVDFLEHAELQEERNRADEADRIVEHFVPRGDRIVGRVMHGGKAEVGGQTAETKGGQGRDESMVPQPH